MPQPKRVDNGGARCDLCGREQLLTFHHLIPKRNHRRGAFQKRFSKEQMRRRGLMLCQLCHHQLHRSFSEQELGWELNTKEAILAHPEVQRFLAWAKKQR